MVKPCASTRAHALQAADGEHDLAVHGHLAADEAGVAGLRHDGEAVLVGEGEDFRDLLRGAGTQHEAARPS